MALSYSLFSDFPDLAILSRYDFCSGFSTMCGLILSNSRLDRVIEYDFWHAYYGNDVLHLNNLNAKLSAFIMKYFIKGG